MLQSRLRTVEIRRDGRKELYFGNEISTSYNRTSWRRLLEAAQNELFCSLKHNNQLNDFFSNQKVHIHSKASNHETIVSPVVEGKRAVDGTKLKVTKRRLKRRPERIKLSTKDRARNQRDLNHWGKEKEISCSTNRKQAKTPFRSRTIHS